MTYSTSLLFTEHTKAFLVYATIYIIIWVIEMRLALSYTSKLKSNPQTLEDGLTNVMKFGINRTKDNAWLLIFFITMMMAAFQTYGLTLWYDRHYPLMANDTKLLWSMGIVGSAHLFMLGLKPPSLIKKYRTRFIFWMLSVYVSFFILGWLPVTVRGIYN